MIENIWRTKIFESNIFVIHKVLLKFTKILSQEYLEPYGTYGTKFEGEMVNFHLATLCVAMINLSLSSSSKFCTIYKLHKCSLDVMILIKSIQVHISEFYTANIIKYHAYLQVFHVIFSQ